MRKHDFERIDFLDFNLKGSFIDKLEVKFNMCAYDWDLVELKDARILAIHAKTGEEFELKDLTTADYQDLTDWMSVDIPQHAQIYGDDWMAEERAGYYDYMREVTHDY